MFVTVDGQPSVIFQRALKARSLMIAEAVACEIAATRPLTLDEALGLVALYASEGDDKADRAALRWLRRLLDERTVTLSETRRAVEWLELLAGDDADLAVGSLSSLIHRGSPT